MAELKWDLVKSVVLIIVIFAVVDFFGHKYLEKNSHLEVVQDRYFINKLIYGIPLLLVAVFAVGFFATSLQLYQRILLMTLIVVLGIQFRYYLLYSLRFNFYVVVMHYLILAPLIYFAEEKKWLS